MDNEVPFRTMNSEYLDKDIFVLNPINKFLIKKYPREDLGCYWDAYLFTLSLVQESDGLNDVSVIITPEEYYNIPNPSISNCFNKWLEMFKNDAHYRYIFLDNIPGSSEPLSMEVKGIPEESVTALREVLVKINTGAMISRNDIKKAIEDHREYEY